MQTIDPVEIRKRVEKRHKQWLGVLIHLAAYIGGNLFLWSIWLFLQIGILPADKPSDRVLWPLIVMVGWGIALIFYAVGVLIAPWFRENQERAIQRGTERQILRLADEKPKRGSVRLAEDGELIYEEETAKRKAH